MNAIKRGKGAGLIASALLPALLLGACDGSGTTSGPGSVSEGEARAIDEAAEMLEERRLPDGVLPPTGTEAAEGALEDESAPEGGTQ